MPCKKQYYRVKTKKRKYKKKGGSVIKPKPRRVELLPDINGITGVHIKWGDIYEYDVLPKISLIEFPDRVKGELNIGDEILEIQGITPKPKSSINPSPRPSKIPNVSTKPEKINYCKGEILKFGSLKGFWGKEKCGAKMSKQVLNKQLKLSGKSHKIKTFLLIKTNLVDEDEDEYV